MPDQINGSGPKLVNPELFRPIPVDQFNAERHQELLQSTKQMPDGRLVVQPGVREKVGGVPGSLVRCSMIATAEAYHPPAHTMKD